MMRFAAALCMAVAACQPTGSEQVADEAIEQPANELEHPTKQPDGSPLTAAFCATQEADRIYDNIKTCSMVACDQGDKESCEIAQTFATQHAPQEETEVAEPNRTTAKLEGTPYIDARRIILNHGWKPVAGECSGGGVSEKACKQYPEIGNCQGTWPAFCDMTFERPDRCLTLVTYGGAPSDDTVVRDVRFSRGPCSKEPTVGTP